MATYVIKDTVSKAIKKSLIKWGEFPINNGRLRGVVTIKNYRQYMFTSEVDIEFKGELFVKLTSEGSNWCGSDILTCSDYNISKVKLNRYIRKMALKEVGIRMNYFGININDYRNIKNIKWK